MPFGLKSRKGEKADAPIEKKEKNGAPVTPPQEKDAPPQYEATAPPAPDALPTEEELSAAFSNLVIKPAPLEFPDVNTTLAHLKLLETFYTLRQDIAYTDGLFDLWDARAPGSDESVANDEVAKRTRLDALSKIREKRWALYVARAVDRFEAWWLNALYERERKPKMLSQTDMMMPDFPAKFMNAGRMDWKHDMLPPVDVLMVWHAFMLNPRNYLEDCLRFNLSHTWVAGMPWQVINDVIDIHFSYEPPEQAKAAWARETKRAWDNTEDSMTKNLKCPKCRQELEVPWTTSGQPEDSNIPWRPEIVGNGYGDRDLSFFCHRCGVEIEHDILRVEKFRRDSENLILRDLPLGGTIISGTKGVPKPIPKSEYKDYPGTFPNRLIALGLRSKVLELTKGTNVLDGGDPVSITTVRSLIEESITDQELIKRINGVSATNPKGGKLKRQERLAVRRMMARYWDNSQIFCMELSGAVIRQGTFIDKMHKLDWLHSPNAKSTMERLLVKYSRFFEIMAINPDKMAVPTLDVDLAWHTHQLSPKAYFDYSIRKNLGHDILIDHDDKIDEGKLTDGFEWTSKEYEKRFGEVYSECTCWYCEAIRSRHVSSLSKLAGGSKHEKITDSFYFSGAATLCPPDKSAHISSHNAVPLVGDSTQQALNDRMSAAREYQLNQAYAKACKRAEKKGRPPPKREQFYEERFGYTYGYYYPYSMLYMSPFMYPYGFYYIPVGVGVYGGCAYGTCSGGAGAGACSGGACGGGCAAGAAGCGAGGGCGGGGGGCGGGGGGCGGGGGGCGGGGS